MFPLRIEKCKLQKDSLPKNMIYSIIMDNYNLMDKLDK